MATEKRRIDANAFVRGLCERKFDFFAKEQIKKWKKTSTADVGYSVATISDVLDMTPTVDAVEVVRCKDCKHWIHMEDGIGDCTSRRFHLDGHADPCMCANDFCSYGERKDDDD